jgi:ADP-heptose:LPS heptosyltransferase
VDGYVAAGAALAERFGAPTLVPWGPPEADEARAIADALGERARLAPPSTLRQMAALIGTPALLVAPDCLGRHLAIVQDVATVGIFGSTDPVGWTPRTGPHGVVAGRPEDGYASLRDLPPEVVVREIARVVDGWNLAVAGAAPG